jgi:hypothetical protein
MSKNVGSAIEERVNGNHKMPIYTTGFGYALELAPVGASLLDRWEQRYLRHHPQPEPPILTLENGDTWQDVNDAAYREALSAWHNRHNRAMLKFVLRLGVKTAPPPGWTHPAPELLDEDEIADPNDTDSQKFFWLETILNGDDIQYLPQAILGISNVTEAGIADSEKK